MHRSSLAPALLLALASALAACSGSQHTGSAESCHPELLQDVPARPVHALGQVNATCHNLSAADCDDALRRQACRLGATLVYAVTRTPVQDGETLHGTAATYSENDGGT